MNKYKILDSVSWDLEDPKTAKDDWQTWLSGLYVGARCPLCHTARIIRGVDLTANSLMCTASTNPTLTTRPKTHGAWELVRWFYTATGLPVPEACAKYNDDTWGEYGL